MAYAYTLGPFGTFSTLKKEYTRSREVLSGPLVVFSVSSPVRVKPFECQFLLCYL